MQVFIRGAARALLPSHSISLFRSSGEWLGTLAVTAMLVVFCSGAFAHDYKAGNIEITHPWSRAVPEGAKVSAGYLTLTNSGAEADRLVSATGEVADKVEIHEMAVDSSGVMTMRQLEGGVEVPAGATLELKPGGVHIMFMSMKDWAKEGAKFKGTLTFEKAGSVDVEFEVQGMGNDAGHGHGAAQPADGHASHGG
ncbi:MAG: copper chaperone PCu(A)C [Rhizobiaceae bacterium]|nr:copper chaperone PCu(A)C [Rhizobiaceae bacterium]